MKRTVVPVAVVESIDLMFATSSKAFKPQVHSYQEDLAHVLGTGKEENKAREQKLSEHSRSAPE